MSAFQTIKTLLFSTIIGPLVAILLAVAVLYFLWGIVKYIQSGENPTERESGARHMFWGIVGLAIMISAFGIVVFIFNSVKAVGGDNGYNNKPLHTPTILTPGNQGF